MEFSWALQHQSNDQSGRSHPSDHHDDANVINQANARRLLTVTGNLVPMRHSCQGYRMLSCFYANLICMILIFIIYCTYQQLSTSNYQQAIRKAYRIMRISAYNSVYNRSISA